MRFCARLYRLFVQSSQSAGVGHLRRSACAEERLGAARAPICRWGAVVALAGRRHVAARASRRRPERMVARCSALPARCGPLSPGDRAAGSAVSPLVAGRNPLGVARRRAVRCAALRAAPGAIFETFVTAEGQHAAAGQLPGDSRPRGGASDFAHQSRPLPALHGGSHATSAGSERATWSSVSRRRSLRWGVSSDSVATSTTGTTRRTCVLSIRSTSPRWTAEISRAT